MKKCIGFLIPVYLLLNCSHPSYKDPHIVIKSNMGDIELELYKDKAPKTVAAFLSYIDSGFYTNSNFYRVVIAEGAGANSGVIQGGIFKSNHAKLSQLPGIAHESTALSGLSHTSGIISLARTGEGTANTEFFICIGDQSHFDSGRNASADNLGYAAFGKVVSGMDVVRRIQSQPSNESEAFDKPVEIEKIKRL